MNADLYNRIRKKYGKQSSWAIWDGKDTSVWAGRDYQQIIDSGKKLNPNIVMVGLNPSAKTREKGDPLDNFHDPNNPRVKLSPTTLRNARKLPCVFCGTIYEGAYMTDIIKDIHIPKSEEVMKHMRAHPKKWKRNMEIFKKELKFIGAHNPKIIAFGRKASEILARFKIEHTRIPHYGIWGGRESYKKEVAKTLPGIV